MKTIVLGMAFIVGAAAFGSNPLVPDWHRQLQRHQQRLQRMQRQQRHQQRWEADPSCTNFAGNWKGACTDQDGKRADMDLKLGQEGCDTLKIGDFSIPLDGYMSINSTTPTRGDKAGTVTSVSFSLDWNKSRTELEGTASFLVKSLSTKAEERSSSANSFKETLKLDGGKLLVSLKSGEEKAALSCEFTKQN